MEYMQEQGTISFLMELWEAVLNTGNAIWDILMTEISIPILNFESPLIAIVLGSSFTVIFIAWLTVQVINLFT